ncbi:MAG: methyltransferase domain-containing protein [Ardenticatenaceae bacterium]
MNSQKTDSSIPRCDYEGSQYQSEFWAETRSYEDHAERIALRKLLPAKGRRIIEIGAGAGRLGDLYLGYDEIYLLDYAKSQVEQARARWGTDPRFVFVQGDIYQLPFPTGYFDTVVTVRVLHHVKALPQALAEVARITAPRGIYVTEFANKRHAKAIMRYTLGKGKPGENPFSLEPFEFVPLNIDHHPRHMERELELAGFTIQRELAASFFRVPALKRMIPTPLLGRLDGLLQGVGAPLRVTPSIFFRNRLPKNEEDHNAQWRCPRCHNTDLLASSDGLRCQGCEQYYPQRDGIYQFRTDEA